MDSGPAPVGASRNDEVIETRVLIPAARDARVMHHHCPLSNQRAQGAPDASAPVASHAKETLQERRNNPALPAQWFTAYTRSPRCTGLLATVASQMILRDLIPASGNRDHAISLVRSRIARLAIRTRPSHPAPRFVTIAKRPSGGGGMREDNHILRKNGRQLFFLEGLDVLLIKRSDLPVDGRDRFCACPQIANIFPTASGATMLSP
jgi:hypothetical protein